MHPAPKDNNQTPPLGRRAFLGAIGGVAAAGAATLMIPPTVSAVARSAGTELPEGMRAPKSAAMVSFSDIDGTPVYYWRSNPGNQDPVTWQCTQDFLDTLVVWIRELRSIAQEAGYGNVQYLVSAGFYVNKEGQHGAGTAMDLDVVQWDSGQVSSPLDGDHTSSDDAVARRYLGVEATLRRQFCYVLDGWYPNHHDHFHADFASMPPLLSTSGESATNFVQATCNRFQGSGLDIDGIWGPNTQREYERMLGTLGVTGDPTADIEVYRDLLHKIAVHGFANTPF